MNRILALQRMSVAYSTILAHCGSNQSCNFQSCSNNC